jgi:hypothetical protein
MAIMSLGTCTWFSGIAVGAPSVGTAKPKLLLGSIIKAVPLELYP